MNAHDKLQAWLTTPPDLADERAEPPTAVAIRVGLRLLESLPDLLVYPDSAGGLLFEQQGLHIDVYGDGLCLLHLLVRGKVVCSQEFYLPP